MNLLKQTYSQLWADFTERFSAEQAKGTEFCQKGGRVKLCLFRYISVSTALLWKMIFKFRIFAETNCKSGILIESFCLYRFNTIIFLKKIK